MTKTWILVANASRARCFERDALSAPLNELADFVFPHTRLGGEATGEATDGDISGDAGKGHGRTAHAGTQFEPRTEASAKDLNSFARQLADFLNKGVAAQRCDKLALIAASRMLGELKPLLSPAAEKMLQRSVAVDLTYYQGAELRQRVNEALSLPG